MNAFMPVLSTCSDTVVFAATFMVRDYTRIAAVAVAAAGITRQAENLGVLLLICMIHEQPFIWQSIVDAII